MDWTLAIDRNRDALMRMLNVLFAMLGDNVVAVLPRHVRTGIWRVLRPAESAFRRLIVVALVSMALEVKGYVARPAVRGLAKGPRVSGGRVSAFALFDRRHPVVIDGAKRVTRGNPRVWSPGMDYPVFVVRTVPLPDDIVSAERLRRRMLALRAGLDDLPKQARRLARWQAKRDEQRARTGKNIRPMRPGRPPGRRMRQTHPVDVILSDCHALALYALHDPPYTS